MKSIAILIPYIGKLPNYFPFWLESAGKNPTIDFFLFTDNVLKKVPNNIHIFHTSFEELKERFYNICDFKLSIKAPYKFCDLKPTYGEAFYDILSTHWGQYDFWGYSDIDLIYGDLRKWLTDEILSKNDRIFGLGHLSLYRNTLEMNSLYKKIQHPDYREVFSFSEGCAFDEFFGISKYCDENLKDRFYHSYPFDDIDCNLGHFEAQMKRKELKGKTNFIYSYEDGKLFRYSLENNAVAKDEIMYVHFQKRKMEIFTQVSEYFWMIPNKFIPCEPFVTPEDLKILGKGIHPYWIKYSLLRKRINGKLKKLFFSEILNGYKKPEIVNASKYYKE